MLATLINLLAAPSTAYHHLRQQPSFLLPLLLVVVGIAATNYLYFATVDPSFMVEDMLEQAGDDLTGDEREEARKAIEAMSDGALKWITTISGLVAFVVFLALHALYFFIVSMFNGTAIKYLPWFSFVCWSNLPLLFASVASIVAMLLANGNISLSELNPLAISNLLGFQTDNPNLKNFLSSLDLTRLWSIVLMVIGYQVWTQKSWFSSTAVVLAPTVTLLSVWLYFIL